LCLTIIFTGCAQLTGNKSHPHEDHQAQAEAVAPKTSEEKVIKDKLITQYNQWKGTPYKYDHISNKGIDCSGYMIVTFKSQFHMNLPRTTGELANLGTEVNKKDLKIGDLVFFKTGKKTRHVGVYMGNDTFMHSSTSIGVTISSLGNEYWLKSYWKAKRILT